MSYQQILTPGRARRRQRVAPAAILAGIVLLGVVAIGVLLALGAVT